MHVGYLLPSIYSSSWQQGLRFPKEIWLEWDWIHPKVQEWALVGLHQPAQLPMSLSPGLAWRLVLTQSEPTHLERLFGEAFWGKWAFFSSGISGRRDHCFYSGWCEMRMWILETSFPLRGISDLPLGPPCRTWGSSQHHIRRYAVERSLALGGIFWAAGSNLTWHQCLSRFSITTEPINSLYLIRKLGFSFLSFAKYIWHLHIYTYIWHSI